MNRSRILQVLAILLLIMGSIMCYTILQGDGNKTTILAGIGPIIMGVALLILSNSKAVRGQK